MNYKSKLRGKTFIFKVGSFNNVGGAETKALTLAKILKEEFGARVIFMANGGDGDLKARIEALNIKMVVFSYKTHTKGAEKLFQIFKQILFLRKLKPDFILPWSSDNCKQILPFWKYTGAKYAWWNMQDEGRGLYKTKNEERLMKEASDIISNSIAGEQFITENYDISGKEIILYNNPTEIPDISSIKPFWRKELGIDSNTILVSMFANITRWKDHETLFKAWAIVQNYFEEKGNGKVVKLVLAGDCRETTDDLKILGFDLNIAKSVEFLGSISKVNELMLESDLVVHSSNHEGCPNAVCEAMALGKAVVATDIPGDREALSDKFEDYTLTRPNDEMDLAEKIITMLENKKLVEEIGIYNKQRIQSEYTLEKMIETLVSRFNNAV